MDESASLFENALAFARVEIKHSWSKWNQPVDYKEWGMPAHMVNAYYNPQKNLIVFPAAIYRLHSMTCISRLLPTTVVLVRLLPTRFLMLLTQMVLPLMKMVVSRIGGQRVTMPVL